MVVILDIINIESIQHMFIFYQTGWCNMFKKITLSFLTLLLLCSCSYQEPRKVHTEQSEISKNFPIILLDAKDSIDQAHIICAIQSGQLQPTNKYQYNNQALSSFLFKPATEVHTNIIDTISLIPGTIFLLRLWGLRLLKRAENI